jgi:translocation protein SEC72
MSTTAEAPNVEQQVQETKAEQIYPGVQLLDNFLQCSVHGSEFCMECELDFADTNLMARAFRANQGYLPPPNPATAERVAKLKAQGNDSFKAEKYEEAIGLYTEGIKASRTRPVWDTPSIVSEEISVLLSNRAACFLEIGDFSNALYDSEIVTNIKPNWPKGFFRKGRALVGLGMFGEAVESFELALALDPESKDIRQHLDTAYENI